MRRNSGDDESRNRHLDPTVRERERQLGKSGAAVLDPDAKKGTIDDNRGQRTTGMGSSSRKSGGRGEGG